MLIQELIDELERVKSKVGNVEILIESADGQSLLPEYYKEFDCCFSLKEHAPMYKYDGVKYDRKLTNDGWYGMETKGAVIHFCQKSDVIEDDKKVKELLEKRGYSNRSKPRVLI